jgi:class 3 adenylate cyclase
LFTDIESSSSRWEADAVEMRAVLARHDDLLSSVIEKSGGFVFKHLGDGLCAAFPSAPQR